VGVHTETVVDDAFAEDRMALARRIATVVRTAMASLPPEDRLVFRMRFEGRMSVADISRALYIEQKPLYRRLQRMLLMLRKSLEQAGIQEEEVNEVLSSRHVDLDFGFEVQPSAPDMVEEEDL